MPCKPYTHSMLWRYMSSLTIFDHQSTTLTERSSACTRYWVLNNCIPRCFCPQLVQVQLAFLASFSSLLPFSIQTPRPVARLRVVSEVAPWSTLIPWYLDHKLNSCFLSYHAIPRIYSWRCSMLQETRLCSAFQVSILFLVQCCWCLL